jgi:hypothetical protein
MLTKKISLLPLQEFQMFVPNVERDERVYHIWGVFLHKKFSLTHESCSKEYGR